MHTINISLNDQVVEIMQINVRSLMEREQKLADLDNRAGKAVITQQCVEKCFLVPLELVASACPLFEIPTLLL
jgi:hypothetical protein